MSSTIEGVVVQPLVTHEDERCFFREVVRASDAVFAEDFGQLSHSMMRTGVVKAWHLHTRQIEWWYVAAGQVKLALHDLREASATRGITMEVLLGDEHPLLVRIPPGVAHGCKCLSGPAHLFYIATLEYDPAEDLRIPEDDPSIGYDWQAQ